MSERGYATSAIDNSMGLGRSVSVLLPNNVWAQLDGIAKVRNTNKAKIIRSLIDQLVASECQPRKEKNRPRQRPR